MRYGRTLLVLLAVLALAFVPVAPLVDTTYLPGSIYVYFIRGIVEVLMFVVGMFLGYMAKKVDVLEGRVKR